MPGVVMPGVNRCRAWYFCGFVTEIFMFEPQKDKTQELRGRVDQLRRFL